MPIYSITQSSQTCSDRIPDKEKIGRWSVQSSPLISKQIEIRAIGLKACDIDVQACLFREKRRQIMQRMLDRLGKQELFYCGSGRS
jgi:hypothetical protein